MSCILIVEADDTSRKLTRDILHAKGFSTLEATTTEMCLRLTQAHLPALVVMDVEAPSIHGMELLRALRSDPLTASIPIATFISSVTAAERRQMSDAGFDALLSNPIKVKEFLATITQLMRGAPV